MENLTRHRLAIGAMGRRTSRCNGPGLALLAPRPLSGDVRRTRRTVERMRTANPLAMRVPASRRGE